MSCILAVLSGLPESPVTRGHSRIRFGDRVSVKSGEVRPPSNQSAVETVPWKRPGSSGYYIWHRHQTGNECIQVAVTLNQDDYLERDNGSVSEALMRRLFYCETEEITTEYDENQRYRI